MNKKIIITRMTKQALQPLLPLMLVIGGAGAASAQEARALSAFEAGAVADQLEMDVTPIPAGMGALFVPSLTQPGLEPPVQIYFKGERVAVGQTGARIVLPPGEYTVVVGHGDAEARPHITARVIDGVTTPVEQTFGGLRVTAVDQDGNPIAVRYALKSARGEVAWGSASTAAEGSYGATRTWLLPAEPVVIELVGAGSDGTAIAVPLGAGELVRYRLVLDRGRLVRGEIAEQEIVAEERWWRLRWVVGGDVGFNRTAGRLGSFNGDSLRLGLFTRASVGVDVDNHLALLNLGVDESWISYESLDGQELKPTKIVDDVNAELYYTYRLGGVVGPYARAQARTTLFKTEIRPEGGATLQIREKDGSTSAQRATEGEAFELMGALYPLDLREAAGVELAFVDNETVTFSVRAGAAARQATYDGGLYLADREGDTLRLIRLADDRSFGAEAGVKLGLRLGQTVSIESSGDLYLPSDKFDMLSDPGDLRPIFRLDSTATLAVNSFLAVVYDLNILREAYEIEEAQLSHVLSLRLQHTLF